MRHLLLIIALAMPLSAQIVLVDGREVRIDTNSVAQMALYDTLLAWRAAYVDSTSSLQVAALDSAYAAILDSTGISLHPDRLDAAYIRVRVPQTERLLVAALHQWVADGAEAVSGDTIRADVRLAGRGLARLEPFWGVTHGDSIGVEP